MTDSDSLFERLARLDEARFSAVAQRLERQQLQQLVVEAARGQDSDEMEVVRRLLDVRRDLRPTPAEQTRPEVRPAPDPTLLSWDKLEGVLGSRQAVEQLDRLFDAITPIQDQLGDTSIDAFGCDVAGVETLLERHLSVQGFGAEPVIQRALDESGYGVEFDAGGVNLVWFTRGPNVRRRPYIYLVADGQVTWGDVERTADDVRVSPFVATYHGDDADVTPASWTEWFSAVGIERGNMELGGASLSLSRFQSSDGPLDVARQFTDHASTLFGLNQNADTQKTGWTGWSLGLEWGGGSSEAAWVGSSYYG